MDAESFGKRLRQLRVIAGMTRLQLADASKISLRTIESWEQGRGEPLIGAILKLAAGLGVSPSDLLVDPPDDFPPSPHGRPPKPPAPMPSSAKRPRKGTEGAI